MSEKNARAFQELWHQQRAIVSRLNALMRRAKERLRRRPVLLAMRDQLIAKPDARLHEQWVSEVGEHNREGEVIERETAEVARAWEKLMEKYEQLMLEQGGEQLADPIAKQLAAISKRANRKKDNKHD